MNKQLACVEYEGLTADQEREIFQVCFTPYDLFNSLIKYPKVAYSPQSAATVSNSMERSRRQNTRRCGQISNAT